MHRLTQCSIISWQILFSCMQCSIFQHISFLNVFCSSVYLAIPVFDELVSPRNKVKLINVLINEWLDTNLQIGTASFSSSLNFSTNFGVQEQRRNIPHCMVGLLKQILSHLPWQFLFIFIFCTDFRGIHWCKVCVLKGHHLECWH